MFLVPCRVRKAGPIRMWWHCRTRDEHIRRCEKSPVCCECVCVRVCVCERVCVPGQVTAFIPSLPHAGLITQFPIHSSRPESEWVWRVVQKSCRVVVLRVGWCATWLTAGLSLVGDPCSTSQSNRQGRLSPVGPASDIGSGTWGNWTRVVGQHSSPKIFDAMRVLSVA